MIRTMAILLATLTGFATPAFAVYKCEADGKVTYSDEPCPGGKQLDLNITSVTNSSNGDSRLKQEKATLQKLEKERHRREAVEQRERQSANRANATRQKKCDGLARRQKRAAEDVSKSVGKANEKAKLKARRITEDYEAECGRWPNRELSVAH